MSIKKNLKRMRKSIKKNVRKILENPEFIDALVYKAISINKTTKKVLVFPEIDPVILKACSIIKKKKIASIIIVGNRNKINTLLPGLKIKNIDSKDILDISNDQERSKYDQNNQYANEYVEMRKVDGKTVTLEEAKTVMSQTHFFAAMLVHKGIADGMISGINSETKPYHPAFYIIKTRPEVLKASGLMIMQKDKNVYLFADVALNIAPTSEELASIAITSADTASRFDIEPKIAMLSFSTRDSAKHELVEKMKLATKLVKQKSPTMIVDGEIQLDAAIVPSVAEKKCPGSVLDGNANVLIFPDLNSGNIGYKLAQRLGDYKAVGPIMQGLNKPVNDLSRGASVEDVVELAAITVLQAK